MSFQDFNLFMKDLRNLNMGVRELFGSFESNSTSSSSTNTSTSTNTNEGGGGESIELSYFYPLLEKVLIHFQFPRPSAQEIDLFLLHQSQHPILLSRSHNLPPLHHYHLPSSKSSEEEVRRRMSFDEFFDFVQKFR